MKKLFFIIFFFMPALIFCQKKELASLTIIAESGNKFFLFLNGEKQNTIAASTVYVKDLSKSYYMVKIIFDDSTIAPVSKTNVYVSDAEDVLMNVVYKLSKSSGSYKLRFHSMNTAGSDVAENTSVVIREPVAEASVISPNSETTTDGSNVLSEQVVKVDTPSKKIDDKGNIVILKKSKTSIANNKNLTPEAASSARLNDIRPKKDTLKAANIKSDKWACGNEWPMWKADYITWKKKITDAKGEKSKLAMAKDLASANCLSCDQVIDIAALLSAEESKLAFAKFAYNHTIDLKNYSKVSKVFVSNANKEELKKFISTH